MLINVYVAGPDPDPDPNPMGEGQRPTPNECNSDNIFWKWEMGKGPHPQKGLKILSYTSEKDLRYYSTPQKD